MREGKQNTENHHNMNGKGRTVEWKERLGMKKKKGGKYNGGKGRNKSRENNVRDGEQDTRRTPEQEWKKEGERKNATRGK